eukprot:6086437-Alexandrium_andersonii.AAC.1
MALRHIVGRADYLGDDGWRVVETTTTKLHERAVEGYARIAVGAVPKVKLASGRSGIFVPRIRKQQPAPLL